jgi:L-threonylcarbamoyladenylate synthase
MMLIADKAAKVLRRGGVIAYPTEGVFGLGCLPHNLAAVQRLLNIKQRESSKVLILIAASAAQFDGWVELPDSVALPEPLPLNPITWIAPAGRQVDPLIRGNNDGVAIRITTHPVARSICERLDSPIVSTSANLSGRSVARNQNSLRRQFEGLVDYVVPGPCGPSDGPSEIRNLIDGRVIRQG